MAAHMEQEVNQERMWREEEGEFMVQWFYDVSRPWKPSGSEKVLPLIKRFEKILHDRTPDLPPRSGNEIVRKLIDVKNYYKSFAFFIDIPGVTYEVRKNKISIDVKYWSEIGLPESQTYWRFRQYGMKLYEERKYLFHEGCLDLIDWDWLKDAATGMDPRRLRKPFA